MHKSAPIAFGSIAARPPLATPGMRIGLIGGSFNPPHEGHRVISQVAIKRLGLDRVWWLVTPGNPLKSHDKLAPLAVRMRGAEETARDRRIIVTDLEKGLASSFTVGTLRHLRLRFPQTRFVWIMGADCLAGFHRWLHWQDIFKAMPVAVVDRPGWRLKAMASPAAQTFACHRLPEGRAKGLANANAPAWVMLTGPLMPISSTAIRSGRALDQPSEGTGHTCRARFA